jgi:hypothetical protein
MNEWVCGGIDVAESVNPDPNIYQFRKTSDITRPAGTWLTWDESTVTIDDGCAANTPGDDVWENPPATFHNNGNGMSFVDGHSILRQWHDPAILGHNVTSTSTTPQDGGADLRWLYSVTTYGPTGVAEQ